MKSVLGDRLSLCAGVWKGYEAYEPWASFCSRVFWPQKACSSLNAPVLRKTCLLILAWLRRCRGGVQSGPRQ